MPSVNPFERWDAIAELVKLCVVSTRVANIRAPLNLMLVGPPGDGKTEMLLRASHLHHVHVLSDATYMGLCAYLDVVKDGLSSCLVLPDFGSIIGRRKGTATQSVATLAAICAEGVRHVRVGRLERDFRGACASVLTAITPDDLAIHYDLINANAFLSRLFLVDFRLSWDEVDGMLVARARGDHHAVEPFAFPTRCPRTFPLRSIKLSAEYSRVARGWWRTIRRSRADRWFAFRTHHALEGCLMAAAYIRGAREVARIDVKRFEKTILPLVQAQVKILPTKK